ncbi:hypothetical protein KTO58_23040 [Chitinophaga pendula]|uniref:hypothetical protein n=1 Tax=Chitinophaga TaxID=79328 RepID=UPI000BAEAD5E|nr:MULTISPECIES: hypothetical protein [Chitinophaga]ASZ10509.1 hypothetical protein CK934_05730 [Chitinophaga sp. MD30]UCJ06518.1 hypothetical protein KTO58_23040 [Chitinophaga pendula]
MRLLFAITCLLPLVISGCGNAGDHTGTIAQQGTKDKHPSIPVDSAKAAAATAVLHVKLIARGEDRRYIWDTVQINQVIQNKTGVSFGKTLAVAHYAWKKGIPSSPCLIYIVPMTTADNTAPGWMLLNGHGKAAVTRP